MDSNKYNPSLLSNDPYSCHVCGQSGGQWDFARHEVFYGPLRTVSKKAGLWCYVCPVCHEKIHHSPGRGYDLLLKHEAQAIYEKENGHDAFMALIGKNYL